MCRVFEENASEVRDHNLSSNDDDENVVKVLISVENF